MKKLVVYLSVIAMMCSLASCGKTEKKSALIGGGTEASQSDNTDKKSESKSDKKAKKDDDKKSESKQESKSEQKKEAAENGEVQEQEKVTPTFMFFVSKSDKDYDKAMSNVEELKNAYKDKINFDIVDIDENPEAKDNFPVEGQTPVLIMLNTSNDISAFQFKISDKAQMEAAIKDAVE